MKVERVSDTELIVWYDERGFILIKSLSKDQRTAWTRLIPK